MLLILSSTGVRAPPQYSLRTRFVPPEQEENIYLSCNGFQCVIHGLLKLRSSVNIIVPGARDRLVEGEVVNRLSQGSRSRRRNDLVLICANDCDGQSGTLKKPSSIDLMLEEPLGRLE